jgi:hypothetical protein
VIISQVEIVVVGGIPELNVGDNFTIHQNPVAEPPFSPRPGEFSLFGHMADEEERNGEPEGETTFGFPILDLMLNVNMKNIPLRSFQILEVWLQRIQMLFSLSLIFSVEAIIMLMMHKN